jgi:3-hydroxyisobutyrate dehydrogenase
MKTHTIRIGFIGLGLMGEPMARNLAAAGHALVVWNRSPEKCRPFQKLGCTVANSVADLFAQSDVVILMLASEQAIDLTLGRHSPHFQRMVRERLLINMGTTRPEYSRALGEDIERAGGSYVECPVSGSRKPAEARELVAMIAGSPDDVRFVKPIVRSMCNAIFECGAVPDALNMKLAVNLFLITMVAGLVESFHFAQSKGLNLEVFRAVLNAGPMASKVSTVKLDKLVGADFTPQAAIQDVLKNCGLVHEAARAAGAASPLLDVAHDLFRATQALGHGELDMVAVLKAVELLTESAQVPA